MFVGWVLPEVDLKTKIQVQVVYLEGELPKHGPSSGEVRQAKEGSDRGWIIRYPWTLWATKSPSQWELWAWSTPQNYLDWGKRAWYLPPVPMCLWRQLCPGLFCSQHLCQLFSVAKEPSDWRPQTLRKRSDKVAFGSCQWACMDIHGHQQQRLLWRLWF